MALRPANRLGLVMLSRWTGDREQARAIALETTVARSKIKKYSPPTAMQLRDALPRASAASLRPCQKWNPAWGRNDVCQVSMRVASPGLRLECMYCPNVVRLDSTNRFVLRCEMCARADTHTHRLQTPRRVHQYRNFGKLEYSEQSRFVCTDCTGDIAMNQGQFQVQLCFWDCPLPMLSILILMRRRACICGKRNRCIFKNLP